MRARALVASAVLAALLVVVAASAPGQASAGRARRGALELEAASRLLELGYLSEPGARRWDRAARAALLAFRKIEGLPLSGRLGAADVAALRSAAPPRARDAGRAHVEVDATRQVLLVVADGGAVVRVLPVSTGTEEPYMLAGVRRIAHTPRGRFTVYRKASGRVACWWGPIYDPAFITGSVAVHGSDDVPPRPASHGCIRVPRFASAWLSSRMPIGSEVLVYDSAEEMATAAP